MSTPPAQPDEQEPWCCAGRSGYVSECPLCPQYGTSLLDPCPGHAASDENQVRIDAAELHARRAHPGFEYATTNGPRKQWDTIDEPPYGDDGEPDPTWERNVDAGRPGQGWDRFDYTEVSYWRRRKPVPERPFRATCAVLHTDAQGNVIPGPDEQPDKSSRKAPAEDEENTEPSVRPDPRQPAYDAVYEYIRALGEYMPPDPVHRNAVIWRAVHAALGATPVGRCVSSHCVEGGHILDLGETP